MKFVPFTSKNFPYEGNEHIKFAGERTVYVPTSPDPNYKYKEGFSVGKPTYYFTEDRIKVKIESGTKIHFLPPSKLYEGKELGLGKGVFAAFSTDTYMGNTSIKSGYIRISDVQKPTNQSQGRVAQGADTQLFVASEVQKKAAALGLVYKLLSSAKIGSQKPDLLVSLSNTEIQFEIKGTNGGRLITFFDKSVSRGKVPKLVDDLSSIFAENILLDGILLKDKLVEHGFPCTFTGIIDYYRRHIDTTVGFAGDPGVQSSGKMPPVFKTTDKNICLQAHRIMLEHFHANGDHYFAVHDRSKNVLTFYWTGLNDNLLKEKPLPNFDLFRLHTYGGMSHGATRLGMKAQFENETR